jgi:hypothetical protein
MASVWLTTRSTSAGAKRYRVEFRLGGREAPTRYAGSFRTQREALVRKRWIAGELAAKTRARTFALASRRWRRRCSRPYERWQASRVDVSAATATYQRSAIRRAKPLLGRRVDEISAADVAALIGELSEGLARHARRSARPSPS